jgi:hypothetical protein
MEHLCKESGQPIPAPPPNFGMHSFSTAAPSHRSSLPGRPKGMVETVENNGTQPAVMRVVELVPA